MIIKNQIKSTTDKHYRIPTKLQRAFSRDLEILLGAGLHLVDSIELLRKQCKHQEFYDVLGDILIDLKAGKSLADSFACYPNLFNNFYLNLIRVGEATGQLSDMLFRITDYQEKVAGLKRNLVQALSYPALVVLVAIASLTFILLFVLPTFEGLFREFDADLPWLTQIVLYMSEQLQAYLGVLIAAMLLICGLLWLFRRSKALNSMLDKLAVNLPFSGKLVRLNYLALFCRTLGTLLSSGIALQEALFISREITGNGEFQIEVNRMLLSVSRGEELAEALSSSAIFPPMVVQMIMVGEETAELPEMLLKIATVSGGELDRLIALMSTLIEPVMILFLGGAIGAILVSIYLPLFNLAAIMP